MSPCEDTIHDSAIEAVGPGLLAGREREISSNHGTSRKQSSEEHVRAKVHVMMAVNATGFFTVESAEFVKLCFHHILERSCETRMKHALADTLPKQVVAEPLLMLIQARWSERSE